MKGSYLDDIAFLKDEFPELLPRFAEVASIPASENYLDQDFLSDIQKRSKKSNRFITCQNCGKTITRSSMVKHQISCHGLQKVGVVSK